MQLSVLQNFKGVEMQPFPHLCIDNALPENVYNELVHSFPEDIVCSTPVLDNGITYRYKSNPAIVTDTTPNIWKEFFEYHTSKEFFNYVTDIFEESFAKYYDKDLFTSFKLGEVGVRKLSKKTTYVTDCQFVVHEPVDETGTSRTPHLDNPGEIYAGLLYMKKPTDNSTGGNFTLHDIPKVDWVIKQGGRAVELSNPVKEIEYKANSFCMFLNVHNSVHSVTPRLGASERRRSINIIGEYNKNGSMWETQERTHASI